MRAFAALDLAWPADDTAIPDRVLAALDDCAPTAIDEQPHGLRVFFLSAEARDHASRALGDEFGSALTIVSVDVPDEQWAERSQAAIQPVHIGGFLVSPPWYADEFRDKPTRLIVIQPSMGFGTGHHPTTRRCLSLLERADVRGKRIVDVGTGSGVLAIAAATLGAAQVVGLDLDPDALTSARENVELNDASTVLLREMTLAQAPSLGLFDGLTANLTGGLLIKDAAALAALVAPAGWLILSGFQTEEEDPVIRALVEVGCMPIEGEEEDTWLGLRFTRSPTPTPSTLH